MRVNPDMSADVLAAIWETQSQENTALQQVATGKRVTPQDQAIVKVKLGSGEEIPLGFSRRGGRSGPPDAPWQWVTAWHIPTDYPLGSVDYSVLLTAKNGETTTLKPPVLANFTQLRVID